MARTVKNYNENGGDKTVISGELQITTDGKIINSKGNLLIANQADSTATDVAGLVTDFNALLVKLKVAGLMVAN